MTVIKNLLDDTYLLEGLSKGHSQAFEQIYQKYWEQLYGYAYNHLHDHSSSEEVLQEVFLYLWEKRENIEIKTSLSSYLHSAVKYKMLNIMRSQKVRKHYADDFRAFMSESDQPMAEKMQNLSDLKELIESSLASLPPKCQQVYRMSRQQHIPNQEIAEQLHITKKTVENHLTKALKHLRNYLAEYDTIISLMVMTILSWVI
ncbi:RNA polymerase sigma-70 factor [Membranihabitans marinus]|uniref:RNA polymerase sigma-70 factor n=1 Tax=Membranihabitans marinus TaxID=1227546 RepID=UPI001F2C1B06|nr:RNA polymerase sigma-70 factor [Membranihabitans marinus]